MGYKSLGIAKTIFEHAPKYTRIVEPFADNGTAALFLAKKPPKEHIVNLFDETSFILLSFIQNLSGSDKAALKGFDWVGSQETFDKVVSINATDGADFFYSFFYLKHFSIKQKDPEATPLFDLLKNGESAEKVLRALPTQKASLKKTTLVNDDPMAVFSKYSGSGNFLILAPKTSEDIDAVSGKLGSISADFFFAKKVIDNQTLFDDAAKNGQLKTSTINAATIMVATMEVVTNYDNKLNNITEMLALAG